MTSERTAWEALGTRKTLANNSRLAHFGHSVPKLRADTSG
jgi:hypothetical protein